MGEGAAVNVGDYLVQHSTLSSGTALAHLLALQAGTGQGTVFAANFSVRSAESRLTLYQRAAVATYVDNSRSSVSARGNAVFVTDPTPRCDVKTAPERLTVITTTCESLRLWKADSDSLSVRTDDAELILEVTL